MRHVHFFILAFIFCCVLCACNKINSNNKYDALNGNITVTGYVWLNDAGSSGLQRPLLSVPIYLNTDDDTSTYIYQVSTDSVGHFTLPTLNGAYTYTLFTQFTQNGTEYKGVVGKIIPQKSEVINLNVFPININELAITFIDADSTPIQNAPFRLYTSEVIAQHDSVSFAFANTIADSNGQYIRYNLTHQTYYIVSKIVIDPQLTISAFNSVTVAATGLTTIVVKVQ